MPDYFCFNFFTPLLFNNQVVIIVKVAVRFISANLKAQTLSTQSLGGLSKLCTFCQLFIFFNCTSLNSSTLLKSEREIWIRTYGKRTFSVFVPQDNIVIIASLIAFPNTWLFYIFSFKPKTLSLSGKITHTAHKINFCPGIKLVLTQL